MPCCQGKILPVCISLMKTGKMKNPINDLLLLRFLKQETSEQENAEILRWVSSSEENRTAFRKLHELYCLSSDNQFHSKIDVEKAWIKLSRQLPRVNSQKIIYLNLFRKIAVSILFLMSAGFGTLWTYDHFLKQSASLLVQFESPKGEKSKIILADGSQVWLNSQTILKYDAMNPRKVTIQGEAFFDIRKDPSDPFEVNTLSGMKVVVTGTKFNLKCYPDEAIVETTLEEGQVTITNARSEKLAMLKPGQQSRYDQKDQDIKVKTVSAEIYSLWKNNELRFSNISFEELVPRIERWYGVTITLDPKIGKKDRFTMTIKTESLRELLNMLQLTSKFKYVINGSSVKISSI